MNKILLYIRILFFILVTVSCSFLATGCGGSDTSPSPPGNETDTQSHENSSDDAPGGGSGNKPADSSDDDGEATSSPETRRASIRQFLLPRASGSVVYGDSPVSIDASNISEGYVMVRYNGDAQKAKLQITTPDKTVYTYTILPGDYEAFPFSGGDGSYHLDILEHAYDKMYAMILSQDLQVTLSDEFKPFLYPNQYAWYTQESAAASYALQLSDDSSDDLDFVEKVYRYVCENITYDNELAKNIPTDYIPDVDATMRNKKGICFDYASLMTSMLRCQGIPTKLEVGYSGEVYHAWISVYLKETGWVDRIIEFDGEHWSLMDPTLAAAKDRVAVEKYIGDGSNYIVKYSY